MPLGNQSNDQRVIQRQGEKRHSVERHRQQKKAESIRLGRVWRKSSYCFLQIRQLKR